MHSQREALAQAIETLIDLLDQLEPDCDLEEDGCGEVETDEDFAPISLNRTTSPTRAA